jgi:large subunit ribosomal protein L3
VSIELICRKIGMTQVYSETGEAIPVTALEAAPNTIVQIKRSDGPDGYSAVQLGYGERREGLFSKPEQGHFAKAGVAPKRHLIESRVDDKDLEGLEVGQELTVERFEVGSRVDAIGTSKGKGFQGVVKRHGFKIKKRTHGTHEAFRHPGSVGAGAYPGRVFKGKKHAGQMGNERVTVLGLEVIQVDAEKNFVLVRGAVPGHRNAVVRIRSTVVGKNRASKGK